MIQNLVGPPVEAYDFFNRETIQDQIWEQLAGHNLLLLAPRRVGKTSLMYRLRDSSPPKGFEAVFFSVQEVESESAFILKLLKATSEVKSSEGVFEKLRKGPLGRFVRRIRKAGVASASIEWADAAEASWKELGEKFQESLEGLEGHWLFLVDEVPIFVLSLLRQDPSGERARHFLNWFRSLRTRPQGSGRVRWFLAGSIGLDTVTSRSKMGDTINDLKVIHLGPFEPQTADRFLAELGKSYRLPLSPELRQEILRRVGWPIPYYLQLMFSELKELSPQDLAAAGGVETSEPEPLVDQLIQRLLAPEKKVYFDYWRQRLEEELGQPDSEYAVALLNAAAKDPVGAGRETLLQILTDRVSEPFAAQERLRYLLDVLEIDGYLVESKGRYEFRSPLLKEFWRRRVMS
jgi:AAA+ ATPase superfamily predicted ATPase